MCVAEILCLPQAEDVNSAGLCGSAAAQKHIKPQ